MKIFFIGSSLYILYLMKVKFKATYDSNLDTFRIEYLLGGSLILALALPYEYTVMEVSAGLSGSRDMLHATGRFIMRLLM